MSNYLSVLKAMFKNKLRFSEGKSKRSVIGFLCLIGASYALVMAILLSVVVEFGRMFNNPQMQIQFPTMNVSFYFLILLTAAGIVLIFGIISLITTLYLSKDTDFYSVLHIKQSTVFAAKLSFVYISETVIVTAIVLPIMITFGAVTKAWAWYYIISLLMLAIIPAMPLVLAAIVAIPVMFIASKVKHRSAVALAFYTLLFGGFFGAYLYFVFASTNSSVSPEEIEKAMSGALGIMYAFYPYTALSMSVFGVSSYGLGVGASTAVNLLIFVGSSAALLVILMLAAKFMYTQSVKANNQTNNATAKKGEFKSSSAIKALMKREYISSFRTVQVAFQCYAVMILPIIMSVALSIVFGNIIKDINSVGVGFDTRFFTMCTMCALMAMIATIGNAASTTFSREGKAISSLKILPVDIRGILKSKLLAWMAIGVPVSAIAVVIVNVMNFDLQLTLLSVFSLIPLSVVFIVFGALWDLSAPKLNWTDPSQAIKHNGHVTIGQLICIGSGMAVMTVMFILFFNNVSMNIILPVCWALIYAILVIFGVVDILLYRRVDEYYKRIEI